MPKLEGALFVSGGRFVPRSAAGQGSDRPPSFFRVAGRVSNKGAAAPAGSARPGRAVRRAGARGGGRSAIKKQKTAVKRKSQAL